MEQRLLFGEAEIQYIYYKKPEGELGKDWYVFDGNICVNENVVTKDDIFLLSTKPVWEVKILYVKRDVKFKCNKCGIQIIDNKYEFDRCPNCYSIDFQWVGE